MSPFKRNSSLYISYLVLVLFAFVTQLLNQKGEVLLYLHVSRIPWLTESFVIITRLGELQGFILSAFMIVLVGRLKDLSILGISTLLMLLLVHIFKHYVFPDAVRPIVFFEQMGSVIDYDPNYHLNRKHSFPSGHTTAGFTYFFAAALAARRWPMQFAALLLAVSVALSRIYLMQHFVIDTIAGSLLGVMIVTTVAHFSDKIAGEEHKWNRRVLKFNAFRS